MRICETLTHFSPHGYLQAGSECSPFFFHCFTAYGFNFEHKICELLNSNANINELD